MWCTTIFLPRASLHTGGKCRTVSRREYDGRGAIADLQIDATPCPSASQIKPTSCTQSSAARMMATLGTAHALQRSLSVKMANGHRPLLALSGAAVSRFAVIGPQTLCQVGCHGVHMTEQPTTRSLSLSWTLRPLRSNNARNECQLNRRAKDRLQPLATPCHPAGTPNAYATSIFPASLLLLHHHHATRTSQVGIPASTPCCSSQPRHRQTPQTTVGLTSQPINI